MNKKFLVIKKMNAIALSRIIFFKIQNFKLTKIKDKPSLDDGEFAVHCIFLNGLYFVRAHLFTFELFYELKLKTRKNSQQKLIFTLKNKFYLLNNSKWGFVKSM